MTASSPTSSPARRSIRTFNPLQDSGWDELLSAHPAASIFHGEGWSRVLHGSYGHKPFYLADMEGDQALALLPIMEINSPLTGRRGVALPFSDECGVLHEAPYGGLGLFEQALELGRERHWKHLEIRGAIPGQAPATPWAEYAGHTLDLTVELGALSDGLESSVRRAIRKAEKSGVTTRIATSLEAMRSYYDLHCVTRRKHGVPPQPFSFFQSIVEHLFQTKHGFILEAWHEERLVAAGIFLHHGRTAIYKFGASDPAGLNLRGNDLVMWAAIQWFAARGFATFSMGRSALTNEGLRRFKRGFGAGEQTIRYYRHDLRQGKFLAGREEKASWANRMLQLTPSPVFKMMGRILYPHLD